LYDIEILKNIEDQISVEFTGKINILSKNGQSLGHVLFIDGDLLFVKYKRSSSIKAFYNLVIESFDNPDSMQIVVEPEVLTDIERNIHYPYSVLVKKIKFILDRYKYSLENKPPSNIMIRPIPEFIMNGELPSFEEFELLCTLTEFHKVDEIYKECPLLDFEITNSLVGLRKKKALKVSKLKA
jgi:hypothetical protein